MSASKKNLPEPNYFYVNRYLLSSRRWLSEKFTRGQAWVDMFGLANHKDSFVRVRGMKVIVLRGQLGWSQESLAARWKWSRGKVKRFLNELENDGDIVQQTDNKKTIVSINKYDYWQGNNTANSTTNGHQTDIKQYSNNKDNKEKNDNKDTIVFAYQKLLRWWNKKYGTSYRTDPPQKEALKLFSHWFVDGTSVEDIQMAKVLAEHHPKWGKGIDPLALLRTKKQKTGDPADWVSYFLNYEGYSPEVDQFRKEYLEKGIQ